MGQQKSLKVIIFFIIVEKEQSLFSSEHVQS